MNLLRSLLTSFLVTISLLWSSISAFAAEVTLPTYGVFGGASLEGDVFPFPTGAVHGQVGLLQMKMEAIPICLLLSLRRDK